MLIGDKTKLGHNWYPWAAQQIEAAMIGEWRQHNPNHQVQVTSQTDPITPRTNAKSVPS